MTLIGLPKYELDTPALCLDLDRLERNIAQLTEHFANAGVGWRPHTKGIKTPAIAHKLIAAGAIGITCAKLGEAEVMAAAGIQDILIANQITGKHKITRLAALRHHADVKVAVDCVDNVKAIAEAAQAVGVEVGVVIEVDCGMQRAGTAPGEPTLKLAKLIAETAGVRFMGLMSWEGHTLTVTDDAERRHAIQQSLKHLTDSVDLCRAAGLSVEIVSAGGSGTYLVTPFLRGITEIQAGGAIFCDVAYQKWGVGLEPSLTMLTTVTSRPTPQRIICDTGYKALPAFHATPHLLGVDHVERAWFSAEHGVVLLSQPNDTVKVGEVIEFVVGYSDATVCLHDVIYGIRNNKVETVWQVLGRGKLA